MLAAAVALSATQKAGIDSIVRVVMADERIAGLSLGIARGERTLYERGYGMRNTSGAVAGALTVYPIGSVSKQFTAALILSEVADGRIALAAPARTYAPASIVVPAAVTIADLLSQTSGIVSYTDRLRPGGREPVPVHPTAESLWNSIAAEPLAFVPGSQWQYSNSNYLLLGLILQHETGRTYSQLLERRITQPLHLSATGYGIPAPGADVAAGMRWNGQTFDALPFGDDVLDFAGAAGGMTSDVPDLLHWLDGLRRGAVVPPALFAAMATSATLSGGVPANYGYGFYIGDWYGRTVLEHGGTIDGFSSQDALLPADGLELAILSNADGVDLGPLAQSIVAIVDPPLDANLQASPGKPPQNEDPRITADVRAIAATPAYDSFGTLSSVDFLERSVEGGVTYDKYRLTFTGAQFLATIAYRAGEIVESITIVPAAPVVR